MKTRVMIAATVGAATIVLTAHMVAQRPQAGDYQAPLPAYMLKADPRLASRLDAALAKVALPVEFRVPAKGTAEGFIAQLCANKNAQFNRSTTESGRIIVTMMPCLQLQRDVKVPVTSGDTVEGLALRTGLQRSASINYQVIRDGGEPATVSPQSLQVGDVVLFPQVPVWTHVVANPEVAADRESFVKVLADAIACREKDAEECLRRNGVELLNRSSVPKRPQPKDFEFSLMGVAGSTTSLSRALEMASFEPASAVLATAGSSNPSVSTAISSTASPAPMPPPPPLPPAVPAQSTPMPSAPMAAFVTTAAGDAGTPPPDANVVVAPEQWPYDAELLAKILAKWGPSLTERTIIGIADGGLAGSLGSPLSADAFMSTAERQIAIEENRNDEPNDDDEDTNTLVNDLVGAGVERYTRAAGSNGDVNLCKTVSSFQGWPIVASHGTLVSSIASAWPIRTKHSELTQFLPQLVFFRLLGEACHAKADFGVAEAEITKGFEYLIAQNADIISISYKLDQATGNSLKSKAIDVLPNKNALLFVPAGNDYVGNLEANINAGMVCPACLGHSKFGKNASERTVVVGAATSDLRRAAYSSYGESTVTVFAPGEAQAGIDLTGQHPPADVVGTSYATPYAALAAALIRSFGRPNSYEDVRHRLQAATWPLDDPLSNSTKTGVGVVDLVKAAAAREWAVEVKEREDNGQWVRRTYVGQPKRRLKDMTFCEGAAFRQESYHALRLGEADANGGRTLRLYARQVDPKLQQRPIKIHATPCHSTGDLEFTTIDGDVKVLPMSHVTFIQAPWLLTIG